MGNLLRKELNMGFFFDTKHTHTHTHIYIYISNTNRQNLIMNFGNYKCGAKEI